MLLKKNLLIIFLAFSIIFLFGYANGQESQMSVDPEVYETLEEEEFVRVILQIKKPENLSVDLKEEKILISNAQEKLLSLIPEEHFRPIWIYETLWAVSGYIDKEGISIAEKSGMVKRIEYVKRGKLTGGKSGRIGVITPRYHRKKDVKIFYWILPLIFLILLAVIFYRYFKKRRKQLG